MPRLPTRPLRERDAAAHTQRIDEFARRQAEIEQRYYTGLKDDYVPSMTRWWHGRATALNRNNRTVTVQLDQFPWREEPLPPMQCHWGRKAWTASEIVGKRVRVRIDSNTGQATVDNVVTARDVSV